MSYNSPNATVRREWSDETTAGSGAVSAKFRSFQKVKLIAAHAYVNTAGTSAASGHTPILKHGTTSIGQFALATDVANTKVSVTLNRDIPSGELLSITNGTDATGKAQIVYEYEVYHDAVHT